MWRGDSSPLYKTQFMESILIVILLNLVFYFRTLRYGLVSDAMDIDLENLYSRRFTVSYYWDIFLGRASHYNTEVEHLITLLIHTLNCSLIYIKFGASPVSFMAAMLLFINPYNSHTCLFT